MLTEVFPSQNGKEKREYKQEVHKREKVEAIQMPVKGWMAKQNVVYSYNEILFKKRSADTRYDVDRPRKHYVKWKKSVTKATYCMIPFLWIIQNR